MHAGASGGPRDRTTTGPSAVVAVLVAVVAAVPAWAEGNGGRGSITITNAQSGQTYTLYKLFDATTTSERASGSSNSNTGIAYSYSITDGKSLNTPYTYVDASGVTQSVQGSTWFSVDAAGNVTAKEGTTNQSLTTRAFQEWAKKFGVKVGESKTPSDGETQLVFSNLTDGYYFLTSTMGSLVTVTSIAPDQKVTDKNTAPDVVKNEDVKTSSVGDTVTYTIEISVPRGQTNVVFHDRIDGALTLPDQKDSETQKNNYTLTSGSATGTGLTAVTDYVVSYWGNTRSTATPAEGEVNTNGDNITISFTRSYLDALTEQTTVYLTYTATLKDAGINKVNEAYVTYGDSDTESTPKRVYESSFGFKVNKLDNSNNGLSGAQFVLSKRGDLGNLTEDNYSNQSDDLLAFTEGTYDPSGSTKLLTANSSLEFKGLNNDEGDTPTTIVYYLYEVKAPDGYNKLTSPIAVRITPTFSDTNTAQGTQVTGYTVEYCNSPKGDSGTWTWVTAGNADGTAIQASDLTTTRNINVVNRQGQELPSTGGTGTVAFYVIGGALMAGAVAFAVSRRRATSK